MNCAICLDLYKDPRILTCGHSFCEECLKNFLSNCKLSCPTCRVKCQTNDVTSFPINYDLVSAIENHVKVMKEKASQSTIPNKKDKPKRVRKKKSSPKKSQMSEININIEFSADHFSSNSAVLAEIMPWLKLNSPVLVFIFTLCFITLTVISFVFIKSDKSSNCSQYAFVWESLQSAGILILVICYISIMRDQKESSESKFRNIIIFLDIIFLSLWTVIIAYFIGSSCEFSDSTNEMQIFIIGIINIIFNCIYLALNYLQIIKLIKTHQLKIAN